MDIAMTFAGLIAVGVKLLSALKFAEQQDWVALRNQAGAWLIGILVVFWGSTIQGIQNTLIGDIALQSMSFPTKLYVGLAIGSTGSLLVDALKAADNNSTTRV